MFFAFGNLANLTEALKHWFRHICSLSLVLCIGFILWVFRFKLWFRITYSCTESKPLRNSMRQKSIWFFTLGDITLLMSYYRLWIDLYLCFWWRTVCPGEGLPPEFIQDITFIAIDSRLIRPGSKHVQEDFKGYEWWSPIYERFRESERCYFLNILNLSMWRSPQECV